MALNAEGINAIARTGLNGQAPRCDHIDLLSDLSDRPGAASGSPECKQCLATGRTWTRLLLCLTCGWVACSDGPEGGHAKDHYRETDHPVVTTLDPNSTWRWCYVHRRTV
jgi:uncharacterized UBP type Zn finger protein